jgi:hypothetical protein
MPRLLLALALACLLVSLAPGMVLAAEPEWPANPAVHHIVFDSSGPDGQPGLWTWNENVFVGGDTCPSFWSPRWEWSSLAGQPTPNLMAGPDAWPSDPTKVQILPGTRDGSSEQGYLVWNPYRFVGSCGPTFWSPNWVWAPQGSKAQLTD